MPRITRPAAPEVEDNGEAPDEKKIEESFRTLPGIMRPITPKELIRLGSGLIEFDIGLGIGPG